MILVKFSNIRKARKKRFKQAIPMARNKRFIQAIPIEESRPHCRSTSQETVPTPESMFNFADMQDFAQLVELQDDEVIGRKNATL